MLPSIIFFHSILLYSDKLHIQKLNIILLENYPIIYSGTNSKSEFNEQDGQLMFLKQAIIC